MSDDTFDFEESLKALQQLQERLQAIESSIDKEIDASNGYVQQQANTNAQSINYLSQTVLKLSNRVEVLEREIALLRPKNIE